MRVQTGGEEGGWRVVEGRKGGGTDGGLGDGEKVLAGEKHVGVGGEHLRDLRLELLRQSLRGGGVRIWSNAVVCGDK
jgi:hypothetical protein